MKRSFTLLYITILSFLVLNAQSVRVDYSKLSTGLRQIMRTNHSKMMSRSAHSAVRGSICAFAKSSSADALASKGCRILYQNDDLYIIDAPLNSIADLSLDSHIMRLEANRGMSVTLDSARIQVNAVPVYEGRALPQAYDGSGVLVGLQDVGFDLTHPTFYNRDLSQYRIKAFWDQLSSDTIGSEMYVGQQYVDESALLSYSHSRDSKLIGHGTHTSGIAAGSGYDTKYQGLAPGSDICLVNNAVSDDVELIDSTDLYKYTYALDALGFKYIFDTADKQNMPCVINFSEGSYQDFHGDDVLYAEMLQKLIGPGRIIVASAGNESRYRTYMHKQVGIPSVGTRIASSESSLFYTTLKSKDDFDIRLIAHGYPNDTILVSSSKYKASINTELCDTFTIKGKDYYLAISAYPSCYNEEEVAYDFSMKCSSKRQFGFNPDWSFEIVGKDADVEVYKISGFFYDDSKYPKLKDGEHSHNILAPGSYPDIICVGATNYRPSFVNYKGETIHTCDGGNGLIADFSSVGPTFDGRIKPDVVAPGTNISSSFNSYFLEANPSAWQWDYSVSTFEFNGRTYSWLSDQGTSMAAPVVTGAIALWLQAKPDLTTQDVLDVFKHTCTHPDESLSYPNNIYGYGQIDVYRGLLYLLQFDGISEISKHHPRKAHISVRGNDVIVSMDDVLSDDASLTVYSTSGVMMKQIHMEKGKSSYTIPLSGLPSGNYAVQLTAKDQSISGSSLVRIGAK